VLLSFDRDFHDYSAFAALFLCLAVGLIFVVSLAGLPAGRPP
jgi:hypothetical protein